MIERGVRRLIKNLDPIVANTKQHIHVRIIFEDVMELVSWSQTFVRESGSTIL